MCCLQQYCVIPHLVTCSGMIIASFNQLVVESIAIIHMCAYTNVYVYIFNVLCVLILKLGASLLSNEYLTALPCF